MPDDTHPATALVINLLPPPRPAANPRLRNVHARRVRHLHPLALLGEDLLGLVEDLAVDLAEAHAALGDGEVARLLEVVADLGGELLLGPLHLQDGVVDRLALDLAGQHDELLDARGHELALVQELALRRLDAVRLGHAAAVAHHLDDLAPLPAQSAPGVRVRDHGHVLLGLGLDLAGTRGGGGLVGPGLRALDLVLEDVVLDAAVHALLEERFTVLGVVELAGHRVGRRVGRVLGVGPAPGLEHVDGPFVADLDRGRRRGGEDGCLGGLDRS